VSAAVLVCAKPYVTPPQPTLIHTPQRSQPTNELCQYTLYGLAPWHTVPHTSKH